MEMFEAARPKSEIEFGSYSYINWASGHNLNFAAVNSSTLR